MDDNNWDDWTTVGNGNLTLYKTVGTGNSFVWSPEEESDPDVCKCGNPAPHVPGGLHCRPPK